MGVNTAQTEKTGSGGILFYSARCLTLAGFISNTKKKEQGGEEKGSEKGFDISGPVPGTVKQVRMRSR